MAVILPKGKHHTKYTVSQKGKSFAKKHEKTLFLIYRDCLKNSGKVPNITSFSRIRTAYVNDPDYIFIVLSIKHKVFSAKNENTGLSDGIMEICGYDAFDLKFVSDNDVNYNPALGTGQIQIKDIRYVSITSRTTWEFCQLLDKKYLKSSKRSFELWLEEARKNEWIK